MRCSRFVLLGALALTFACGDGPSPDPLAPPGPQALISDAVHGVGGNEHFFWLPPMVGDPGGFNGDFDGSLSPVVEICVLDGESCDALAPLVATFTMDTGPGSETVRVVPQDEHYIVNWHTNDEVFGVSVGPTYRISVFADETELGLADVQLAATGKDLKNLNSDEMIGLKDGRTLPIKFRIEEESAPSGAKLFITELTGNRVFRYDVAEGVSPAYETTITVGESPMDIVFDAAGQMFVVNRGPGGAPGSGSISRVLLAQGPAPVDNGLITNTAFSNPHWAAFRNGELFVAQRYGPQTVVRFRVDPAGNASYNGFMSPNGGDGTRGVQVHPTNGDLFVSLCCSYTGGSRINRYRFGPSPTLVQTILVGGDPHDMVFSPWGELFTANHNANTVSRFTIDASGNAIPNGQITTYVFNPTGLDFSPWGELFVANLAGTVSRYTFDAAHNVSASDWFTVDPAPDPVPTNISGIEFGPGG